MKLELTTWQRVTLMEIIGALRGPAALIRKAGKLLDMLEMTDAEREKVGMQMLPSGAAKWADTEHRWPIDLADRELGHFLKQQVETFQNWPAMSYKQVLDLFEQLGIEGAE